MSFERHIRLHGAFNVRDLGGYAIAAGGTTRWRSLLRADGLHGLSERDVELLTDMGLRTVVDLRNDAELSRQPSPFADRPDIRYHHIPLFDGLAPVEIMASTSDGFDLAARYAAAADLCRPAMGRVISTIAEAEDGIVLFNCSAGKDRTGIVAAMLLSLAGVGEDEIAADYALTHSIAAPLLRRLKEQALSRGLDEIVATRLLSCEQVTMRSLLSHIGVRYGGFAAYLGGIGIGDRHLRLIAGRLSGAPVPAA